MSDSTQPQVLVLASTFPAHATDPVPTFVRDQVIALAKRSPELHYSVLAPHDRRSATMSVSEHPEYTEHRFHYFWPRGAEQLAGRGIMPALREKPALYMTVPFLFVGEFFAALRLARKLRPVVIYAHWFTPQAIVASWVSRFTGIPFVFTTHASDVDVWHRVPGIGARIVRGVSSRAQAITAVSVRSRDKLTAFFEGSRPPHVEIIPMGVDLPPAHVFPVEQEELKTSLGLDGKFVFLFMGRLVEKKGVRYLLEAFKQVEGTLTDAVLVIAGDGPLRTELRDQVAALGLAERVSFAGFVTGEAKESYLRAADVFVVPSVIASDGDAEGLPVSLLEGLAFGLTCIATNESGADGILTHGANGFLCSQRDVDELAHQLTDAAALDGPARAACSDSARILADQFNWTKIANRHFDHLIAPILAADRQLA